MKNFKLSIGFFLLVSLCVFFTGCNDSDDSLQQSRVTVRLTDAPGEYDEVNVEVLDVLIKNNLNADDQGWISIGNITPKVINLLDLTGGVTLLLADSQVPSGYLGQIRLLLGDENTVVKSGISYPLNTPSAQQSGLKLKVNQTLEAGITYDFLLDFDIEHSVVQAGASGNYNLHPVIRVTTAANSGIIKGSVTPIGIPVLASVQVGEVTVSAYNDEMGMFQLNGIPSGTYTVTLTPELSSLLTPLIIENVEVVNGEITDMGALVLE